MGVHQGLLVLFTQPFVFGGKRAPETRLDFRFCIVTMGARDAFPIPVIRISMLLHTNDTTVCRYSIKLCLAINMAMHVHNLYSYLRTNNYVAIGQTMLPRRFSHRKLQL